MTRRERYLKILQRETADGLVYAPNFDHWLSVQKKNGTLNERYTGLSRDDIVRSLEATIWSRTGIYNMTTPDVCITHEEHPDGSYHKHYITPVGTVSEYFQPAGDITGTYYLREHMIKEERDIDIVRFIVENTRFEVSDEHYEKALASAGDDGVVLGGLPWCMPYIQFGKTDCGWERGIYFYYDYTEKVEALMDAYARKIEEAAELAASSRIKILALGDNMDEWTTPPDIFKKYAIPFYKRIAEILHTQNKIFEVHWCGRSKMLLPMVPETGIDVVEAITVEPMDSLTVPRALEMVGDNVVIQGGVPSILMVPHSYSDDDARAYMKKVIDSVPHGRRFVLGMSDNLPANGDIERVRMISEMVNATFG